MTSSMRAEKGDITTYDVDALINPAHPTLMRGGGACGSIHRAAGPRLEEVCAEILKARGVDEIKVSECVTTEGCNLKARFVIHALGVNTYLIPDPTMQDELLVQCYKNIMMECQRNMFFTVAIPSLSTGIFGFPLERATAIAVQTIKEFLEKVEADGGGNPVEVIFVCFDDKTLEVYKKFLGY